VEAVNGIPQVGHEGHTTCCMCTLLDVFALIQYKKNYDIFTELLVLVWFCSAVGTT